MSGLWPGGVSASGHSVILAGPYYRLLSLDRLWDIQKIGDIFFPKSGIGRGSPMRPTRNASADVSRGQHALSIQVVRVDVVAVFAVIAWRGPGRDRAPFTTASWCGRLPAPRVSLFT